MSSADAYRLPPTITPVFDAGNRWTALRAHFAQDTASANDRLPFLNDWLAALPDGAGPNPLLALPLLIETENPRQWLNSCETQHSVHQFCFLIPASSFDRVQAQVNPNEFPQRNFALVACNPAMEDCTALALGFDAAGPLDFEGRIRPSLKRKPGPHLAVNIGSPEIYRDCAEAGFHWFEGTWALCPDPSQDPAEATSRGTLLNLLGLVASDADSSEIEALLKRDANLSYQMLKLVNSVGFSLTHQITSFKQAITLLGRRQLQRWLQLLLYAGHHGKDGASPLMGFAARRAALMEGLIAARAGKQEQKDRAFMTGLFSLLDVLFKAPIADLVVPLNLHDDVTGALVGRDGTLGQLLDLAIASERAPGEDLPRRLDALAITADIFVQTQLKATAWAAQICSDMQ